MCNIETCEKPAHSKGLCQAHYRQAQRRERGLKKPGPKPNPTAPRSRYGEARLNEGNGYHILEVGGQCRKGHILTAQDIYEVPKEGGGVKRACQICKKEAYMRRKNTDSIGVWNKDKTHCVKGHELSGDNLYTHPTMGFRRCLTCHTAAYRKWYLREKYDISVEQFDKMLLEQDNKCMGCNKDFDNNIKVDHDHATGDVRGLLCNGCNIVLGHAYDNPQVLRNLADYLEKFSNTDLKV